MKILVVNTDPIQVNTSTLGEGYSSLVVGWKITYNIEFDNIEGHVLTGVFDWKSKVLDLEEVVKFIHELFTNIGQLK